MQVPVPDTEHARQAEPLFHVVLHQPEIPQNAGNVGRSCLAAGAKLWMVQPLGFRFDAKHLRRAGLDYWKHLQWQVVDSWPALLEELPGRRLWLFSKSAEMPYYRVQFEPGDAFVFGSETSGLPGSLLQQYAETTLRIPIRSIVRSLNLASSVAVATFEARRQWVERGLIDE